MSSDATKPGSPITVRRMRLHDLNHAFAWSVREGWNIGLHDHPVFHATDPEGFFMADRNGTPLGCVSGVAYEGHFGFIGIYIVDPAFRGQGAGLRVFQEAMQYLSGRNVGLDAVIEQQDNYRRSGFRLAYRNIRFGCNGGGDVPPGLVPALDIPFDALLDFDRQHFPAARPVFLRNWIKQPGATAFALMDGGELRGYGMIRPAVHGFLIGPLFARDPEAAELLFQGLRAQHPEQPVCLDVPEINPEAMALAARNGMTPVFETARMYTGPDPDVPIRNIFGVTSFELG